MTASRLLGGFAMACCLAAPVLAQPAARPASMAARLSALEKENAALRADVDRLQALVTQTRRDMITIEGSRVSGYVSGAVPPPIRPLGLPAQQAQADAAIQQQGVGQQLNNLQLQQNMAQDRAREQQLFQPTPPFGAP